VRTSSDQPGPDAAVRMVGLRKEFGSVVAVDGIDLEVPTGGVFGYLGPNGAGKTTSLRMLLGLIRPTAGSVELFGRDRESGQRRLARSARR
jgi:ABC-2 type transport system ATP-binding protein